LDEDLELLAESLCGLGFYIEAVEQQRADCDRVIAPLLAKRLGEPPLASAEETESVESAVASLRADLPRLVEAAPDDAGNAGDREALRTVGRGFHTLKESSRMVGLDELSEIAWQIEKIHNRLLGEELPATTAVVAMIDIAQASFQEWVDVLGRAGRVAPDP